MWFAPEIVQTSAMDCGPAALKCILDGHHIPVSYGRLREACQTTVDGTSIDTLEEVACQLGLDAEQVMLPLDYLFRQELQHFPAIIITLTPNNMTHFIVIWQKWGQYLQIMDPASGRQWVKSDTLLQRIYTHHMPIPAELWEDWTSSEEFRLPLEGRLRGLGLSKQQQATFLDPPSHDRQSGIGQAALDAAIRMIESLSKTGSVSKGSQAAALLEACWQQAIEEASKPLPEGTEALPSTGPIPAHYWTARPLPPDEDGDPQVLLTGAVMVKANGAGDDTETDEEEPTPPLPAELQAALDAPSEQTTKRLFDMMREDGWLAPTILLFAIVLASTGVLIEALLFRGFFELGTTLPTLQERLTVFVGIIVFVVGFLLVDWPIQLALLRAGRHLELKLRVAFLSKLPKLHDRYFQSRLRSDMAERSHSVAALRALPGFGIGWLRTCASLLLTTAGVIWLAPQSAGLVLFLAALSVALPLLLQPLQLERDLRTRTHAGALSMFYFDALLGHTTIKAHGAERTVRREHEGLLVEWMRASLGLLHIVIRLDVFQAAIGVGLVGWLLFQHIQSGGQPASLLLLVYWSLNLPALGKSLAAQTRTYPAMRNIALRLIEPLDAPEATAQTGPTHEANKHPDTKEAMSIQMEGVQVEAGGHIILTNINLSLRPGEHIGVVGSSGAGKSSLVGLILGWHKPSQGQIQVDGEPLTEARLSGLRRDIAWVDPDVTLWNDSLLKNLLYGNPPEAHGALSDVLVTADLRDVLERMPDGFQTGIGEGGALVSGGQGQRIRLGRALLRQKARLVLLDEPFRGLDRGKRQTLLQRVRETRQESTLICITHDVGDTLPFPRVLVIEDGEIIEDGDPKVLASQEGSRYKELLDAEAYVTKGMWSDPRWKRIEVSEGGVQILSEGRRAQ